MNCTLKEEVAIYCTSPGHSEKVQEVLFELGCKWIGNGSTCVQLTDKSWLFVKDGEIIRWDYNYSNVKEVDLEYLKSLLNKENTEETQNQI